MRRRDVIALLGSTAAWPLIANAQRKPVALVGFLRPTRAEDGGHLVAAVRQGLRESGYPAEKIEIVSRWADGHRERLPDLARELAALHPVAIVCSLDATLAAKKANISSPIVFATGVDPVRAGLVSSINHPGGNITGVSFYDVPIVAKRLELLRELVPKAKLIAVLLDSSFAEENVEASSIKAAAQSLQQQIIVFHAGTEQEIGTAFSEIVKSGAGALLVGAGPFFNARRNQLVGLAALNAIPASYALTGIVGAGGLTSYGASITDAYRRAGIYVARILNGENPGDLPIELPTKYEFAINMRTAKALGLAVPQSLLAQADEVIE